MAHHDPHEHTSNQQYNTSQWDLTCPECFKTISADRPPIYNPENCSCIDLGGLTLDDRSLCPPSPYIQQAYDGGTNLNYFLRAQSYASSNLGSINCPEGPEREDPTNENLMNDTNGYTNGGVFRPLPLCPPLGLNEKRHRRFSSSANDMSYQLRRFLEAEAETDIYIPYGISLAAAPSQTTQYLSQDLYIQSQRAEKQTRGSKRSYRSKGSGRGGETGEDGFMRMGVDIMCGMGAWDDGCEGGEYALDISGLMDGVDGE